MGFPPLSSVRKIHLAPLASCPGNRGTVCVFHDSTVILLWKLSAWGGTPTSGKTLLSELISGEQPSLSISRVCLRTGPGAHGHTGAPAKEQRGEQVGGEGRAGEVSPKTPNRDWNTLHCCVLSPSVPERALPWHVTVNTGRLHGNTAIWQKSMGWDMAPMRQIIPWITISSPSCAIRTEERGSVRERKRERETENKQRSSHVRRYPWSCRYYTPQFIRHWSRHKLEVVWGARVRCWRGSRRSAGSEKRKGGSHAPRLFITNATSRWDLQSCTLASVFLSVERAWGGGW